MLLFISRSASVDCLVVVVDDEQQVELRAGRALTEYADASDNLLLAENTLMRSEYERHATTVWTGDESFVALLPGVKYPPPRPLVPTDPLVSVHGLLAELVGVG